LPAHEPRHPPNSPTQPTAGTTDPFPPGRDSRFRSIRSPREFRCRTARSFQAHPALSNQVLRRNDHRPLPDTCTGPSSTSLPSPSRPRRCRCLRLHLRGRGFGPARPARRTQHQRHPHVDPRTGRVIDSFSPNAASGLSAPRPPVVPFDERRLNRPLPELAYTFC
jgi:hypothetical protein